MLRFLAWSLVFALSACSTLSGQQSPDLASAAPAAIELQGRFTAKISPPGQESSSATGRFYLKHDQALTLVELSSPFGQTLAKLEESIAANGNQAKAWLASRDANGQATERLGVSIEVLSQELLGWPVPFRKLGTWLQLSQDPLADQKLQKIGALALPNRLAPTKDSGAIAGIKDREWELSINDWLEREYPAYPARPRLLDLNNPARGVQLRLIVETWESVR